MQRIVKQSKALLLLLAFVLAFSPLSVLADTGEKQSVTYVSLGDSLADGMLSDGSVSKEYDGFAGYIKDDLESSGYEVRLENYGVSGYTSQQVLDGLPKVTELEDADIITISAGANDLLANLGGLEEFDQRYLNQDYVRQLKSEAKTPAQDAIGATDEPVENVVKKIKDLQFIATENIDLIENLIPNVETVDNLLDALDVAVTNVMEANDKSKEANQAFEENENKEVIGALKSVNLKFGVVSNSLTSIVNIMEEEIDNIPDESKVIVQRFLAQTKGSLTATDQAELLVDEAIEAVELYMKKILDIDRLEKIAIMIAEIPNEIEKVGNNMAQILAAITAVNSTAKIYVMGYYNAMPYLPEAMQQMTIPLLAGLNEALEFASNRLDATYIPTFHLFEGQYEMYLPNQTNIHPSDAGYRMLANGFMEEIKKSFPKITEPTIPGKNKISLGDKEKVKAGEQILVDGTDVSLLLPEDLPEGTTLTVTPTNDETLSKAMGLKAVGDVLNFIFEFPGGFDDYEGIYTLVMGYDKDSSDPVDIYYFNEDDDAWESQKGNVNNEKNEISLEVSHFSTYGVFAEEEAKDKDLPPATEDPSDDDKTPPLTKDPTSGSDKGSKEEGKKTITTGGAKLPKTATNNYALLLLGTILVVSGLASLILMRKKHIMTNEI